MRDDTRRRAELADFLKTRRALLRPEQFGLPVVGRRRTPGLRRDEVAQLTGVGVSWYTWLEQGRPITVSEQVLESLAETLRLEREERRHLFILARGMVPVSNETSDGGSLPHAKNLQAMLDALGTNPAYLVDHRLGVVAWNESACHVFGDFSLLSERERNRIWNIFVQPSSRQLYVDWEQAAQHAIMQFRSSYDRYAGDVWFEQFLADLQQASPEFRSWWSQHNIQESCDFSYEKELHHPQVGRLLLASTALIVPIVPAHHIVTFTACSPDTAAKLALLGQPAHFPVLTRSV
ncbi:transcriptional regulator [Ktedonobacteria bacterium brp13]|nr:transcriptional regulator [Ktedonobacteria bacterium brp13]